MSETPRQGDSHSGGKGARAVFLRNGAEVSTVVQSLLGATSIPKEHAEDDWEVLGEVGQECADLLDALGGVSAAGKGLIREGRYLVCQVLPNEWEALLRHFRLRIAQVSKGHEVKELSPQGSMPKPTDVTGPPPFSKPDIALADRPKPDTTDKPPRGNNMGTPRT